MPRQAGRNPLPTPTSTSPAIDDSPSPATKAEAAAARDTADVDFPVLARFPELAASVHPVRIGDGPSPALRHEALGARIGVPHLYVKHDDRIARPYGGGKIRKLEFFLGEALSEGYQTVVTSGAMASHHALATAIYASRLGLGCRLLLMHGVRSLEGCTNLLADRYHGATLELVGGPTGVDAATRRLLSGPAPPYTVPVGGTSPLGNLGYVDAALELEAQVTAGLLPPPDVIVVAMGTMGTAIGLTIGLKLTKLDCEIIAVRVSNVPTSTEPRFRAELAASEAWLRERGVVVDAARRERLRIEPRYLGVGYGTPTRAGEAALEIAAAHDLVLDSTYTAKAFAALIGGAASLRDRTVLFWHTHSALAPPTGATTAADLPSPLRGYCHRRG